MTVARILKRVRNDVLGSVSRIATTEPIVALTFDDGPHPVYTPQLLDLLAAYDAQATFFMLGVHAEAHPALVRRVAAAGHAIGNHTYDHPSFPLIGARERWRQIRACAAAIAPLGSRLFRPPYGHESLASHATARLLGYDVVAWSAHASDWEQQTPRGLFKRLLDQVEPGRIVLLHDAIYAPPSPEVADRSAMIEALGMLLRALSPRYRFVTVPTLLTKGRVVRRWYPPPDRAFLATLPNYDRYAPARGRQPSSSP